MMFAYGSIRLEIKVSVIGIGTVAAVVICIAYPEELEAFPKGKKLSDFWRE